MNRRKWIQAVLVGAALTAIGAGAYAGPTPTPTATQTAPVSAAAVVNGEAVTWAEFEAAVKQAGISVAVPEEQLRAQRRAVLDVLIDNLLLHQYLLKNAPQVTVADVDARAAEFEAQLKKANKTFPDYLKETNQTEGEFRGDLVQSMRWDALAKARVTDAYLRIYYTANKDFFDHVLVRVSHIELLTPANATDADRAKPRRQLTELRADLLAGKVEFAEAAKRVSQSSTAANGGDLGFIARKFMVDESFARAAFATPVNGVSDIVQTDSGLHLIKATERTAGEPSDFNKIKEEVRKACIEEMRMRLVSELRKTAKIEVNLQ